MWHSNRQPRSPDRTFSFVRSDRNFRIWKERARNHGEIRIDEDELGAHTFGLTAADDVGCRSHKGMYRPNAASGLDETEIEP